LLGQIGQERRNYFAGGGKKRIDEGKKTASARSLFNPVFFEVDKGINCAGGHEACPRTANKEPSPVGEVSDALE